MRRVVVTGLGLLSPLACGVEETWQRVLAGQSGAGEIKHFDASKYVDPDVDSNSAESPKGSLPVVTR